MYFTTARFALLLSLLMVTACGDDETMTNPVMDMGQEDVEADTGVDAEDDAGTDMMDTEEDMAPDMPEPEPQVTVAAGEDFSAAEGLAFNGEGDLFVVADTDVWKVELDGTVTMVADLERPVGLAPIGERDILAADFGTNSFPGSGPNDDGRVVRVTPEGEVTELATGIGDPNFLVPRQDGSLLVSDDFTDRIYLVSAEGEVSIFLEGIQSPNGMVETLDGSALIVAQTFNTVEPLTFDSRVWRVPLVDGQPGTPELLVELEGAGANDGVALDDEGFVYVAANVDGIIWKVNPEDGSAEKAAEGLYGVASLAFGRGAWPEKSLFATQLLGGKIWEVRVDAQGAP